MAASPFWEANPKKLTFFKKPPLKGVTPHGVGRCPEGTEGTAQYEGDRR